MVILEIGSTTRGRMSYFIAFGLKTAVVSLLAKILPARSDLPKSLPFLLFS
jgi:hypothetical protein